MLLKKELMNIKDSEYKIVDDSVLRNYIEAMLDNIGSTDSELRDDLIYSTFSHWILKDFVSPNLLKIILETILDKHLFYNIGESNSDSVFTRSFSMLLIPLILMADQKNKFLNSEDILIIKKRIICYIHSEKDLRGYVDEKGWAHALAHAADALNELAKYNLPMEDQLELLNVIKKAICTKETIYTNLEDERLITAVMTILKNNTFTSDVFKQWICSFILWEKTEVWHEEYIIISNVRNFLGRLYFQLDQEGNKMNEALIVKEQLNTMMKNYT
ncbi:DUF2785 domain-containing protein [Lysinibacillus parviboronicapiens]|uniref:DUF2785 domain-containing protein n=1 Tax=Lysinibacillus parviboronicapiens TaxID=436516 RepID=UPI000D367D64|nr:DUF2785 domain-containing protein [Lysinibacillus parviboronicapiens]